MAFAHLVISAVTLLVQAPADLDGQRALEAAQVERARLDTHLAGTRVALEALLQDAAARDGQQEPGDSLYRQARQLLNRNRYTEAAARFKEYREKNPNSERVADALYFEAFALYRGGDINQLRDARARLREQETRFPRAATKSDSKTLRVRILQELAQRGDAQAAAEIRVLADSAAKAPVAPAVPIPPRAPRAPRAPQVGDRSGADCDSDDDDNVKMTALNALMQMDSERAIPILKSVLAKRDSGSVCLRRRAVFLVSQKRAPEATAILLDAARHDPDLDVRLQAVQWLSQVRSDDATAALDSILRTSRDTELQEKALFALSQMKSERAGASLRAYAERSDVPVAVRERAIFWLGQQRSPENAAFLRTLYGRLQNTELKEKCLFALSQMKDQGNDRWLLELAGNDREPVEIRKRALFYAGQSGAPVADLTALYDRTRDREMKEQLIFVYSQRKDGQAVDKLMDIARRETDPELRKKAVFWLGQSRDPRAAQFLVELINQP
jgi:HEAT repeat protein